MRVKCFDKQEECHFVSLQVTKIILLAFWVLFDQFPIMMGLKYVLSIFMKFTYPYYK